MLFLNKDDLVNRLTCARSSEESAFKIRDSERHLLRRETFQNFVEVVGLMLLDMSVYPDPKWDEHMMGAVNLQKKRQGPA